MRGSTTSTPSSTITALSLSSTSRWDSPRPTPWRIRSPPGASLPAASAQPIPERRTHPPIRLLAARTGAELTAFKVLLRGQLMHASAEAIMLPARRPIATLVVCLSASCAILFSGCATERNSRTTRTAPSGAAVTRLQSPEAINPARDPAVARTTKAAQAPSPARPPAEIVEGLQKVEAATRQADLNVPVPSPPVIPPPLGEYPIDLSTALRLAEAENPTIAAARARIIEALALQTAARALLLPSINPGTNYHLHTGNLQRSAGKILNLTDQSLYFGGGAGAIVAGTVAIPM